MDEAISHNTDRPQHLMQIASSMPCPCQSDRTHSFHQFQVPYFDI
jgi:hypothetical protein